ncbi:TDIF2 protein, partial [Turnix velox]|nr:TDIF2 protein [Turnix velox]
KPQADGDVSETESICSSVSGLNTPLIVRVMRRRQIVIPCQLDSPDKKRHDRAAFVNKLSRIRDEDDTSEAESCSSVLSSAQVPKVTRTTRSKQSKKKMQPYSVNEAQSEDISDAESCCSSSHVELSTTTKRVTRSMQIRLQAENTKQSEKRNTEVTEDENSMDATTESEPVKKSGSRPTAELVSDREDASSVTEDSKEPSLPKSRCSSKTIQSEEAKERVLNDMTASCHIAETKQAHTHSPDKKAGGSRQSVGASVVEGACGQIQEHSKLLTREGKLKHLNLYLTDCMSPHLFLESQVQVTPSGSKKTSGCKRADAEGDVQQFSPADKLGNVEQASAVNSPQGNVAVTQRTGSRIIDISVDSGEDQTEEYAECVSHSREGSGDRNYSITLLLSKDDSNESENSDVADIDMAEGHLCHKEADKRTPSLKKSLENSSLHAEGLFVIDTKPGISSNQKYYIDQVDRGSDAESKHEGSEKDEESSDLEEAEDELIDEDEKDEDDDLLKNQIDVLHLSSSIDPGLNVKKLGGLYISFDAKNQKPSLGVIKQHKEKKKDQLLEKSIITPDFEKKEFVPPFRESLHQLKKQRRAERAKTTGDGWFGMKAPEITSELKNDLKVLKMRAALDPKHFYKKNDRDGLPKYFQVGTVVDSPIDFYHSRIPKKQRKRTIVEELLADSEFRRYNKKKYQEIMSERAAFAAGKKNRKKKKFRN